MDGGKAVSKRLLLWLRILALQNCAIAYEPHQDEVRRLLDRGIRKAGVHPLRVNYLAWRYRRQISAELVPWEMGLLP